MTCRSTAMAAKTDVDGSTSPAASQLSPGNFVPDGRRDLGRDTCAGGCGDVGGAGAMMGACKNRRMPLHDYCCRRL